MKVAACMRPRIAAATAPGPSRASAACLPRRTIQGRTIQSHSGLLYASTFSTSCRASEAATPLEESETVKTINRLLGQVRSRHPGIHGRIPTRLNTQTWSEYAKSQQLAQTQPEQDPSKRQEALRQVEELLAKPKRMHDSYVELQLPFSKDPQLLENYIATSGQIRLGKIFEDLDNLAGDIAYQHVLGGRPKPGDRQMPIFIVTASVDRLDLVVDHLQADCDYRLSGLPIYVGSSSMEVLVAIDEFSPATGQTRTCLTGRFTMVTRNAITGKSQHIPPLEIHAEDEQMLFAFGEGHKKRKRAEFEMALNKVPPTQDEARQLHQQWLRDQPLLQQSGSTSSAARDSEVVVASSTSTLSSTQHVHPQSRNVHMKVFGGFLMRQAYELAWMVGASFVNQPVSFLALDALSFHSPVPVGALLSLTSQVDYTAQVVAEGADTYSATTSTVAAISVLAEVVDLETGARQKTNTFHFSFDLGPTKKRVSPATYQEAMNWIEGKRRVEHGLELRRLYADGTQGGKALGGSIHAGSGGAGQQRRLFSTAVGRRAQMPFQRTGPFASRAAVRWASTGASDQGNPEDALAGMTDSGNAYRPDRSRSSTRGQGKSSRGRSGRFPSRSSAPRDSEETEQALARFKDHIKNENFDGAWTERAALDARGEAWKVGRQGRIGLRKLITRLWQGKAHNTSALPLEECVKTLLAEDMEAAMRNEQGANLVAWTKILIGLGREQQALEVLDEYFARAKWHQHAPSSDPRDLTHDVERSIAQEQDLSVDFENAQANAEFERHQAASSPPSSSLRSYLFIPDYVPDLIILKTWLHLRNRNGDYRSVMDMVRRIPMPRRGWQWVSQPQRVDILLRACFNLGKGAQADKGAQVRGSDEGDDVRMRISPQDAQSEVARTVRAMQSVELAWGLDRPREEVGQDPIAVLLGSLSTIGRQAALARLGEALLEETKGGANATFWVEGLPRPAKGPSSRTQPDVKRTSWAVLLTGTLSSAGPEAAARIWAHMASLGLRMGPHYWNALLSGYSKISDWAALERVWAELSQKKGDEGPDARCYNTMIHALFTAGKPDEAMYLFEESQHGRSGGGGPASQLSKEEQARHAMVLYNTMLIGLLRNRRYESAQTFLQGMLAPDKAADVPSPNVATLNILLRAHARAGDLNALIGTLEQSQQWGVQPDTVTYSTVLDAMIRHGDPSQSVQAVAAVRKMMEGHKVRLNTVTWTTMIKGVLSGDRQRSMQERMESGGGDGDGGEAGDVATDEEGAALAQIKLEQVQAALAMLGAMRESRVKPNEVTCGAVIQGVLALESRFLRTGVLLTGGGGSGSSDGGDDDPLNRLARRLRPLPHLGEGTSSFAALQANRKGSCLALSVFEDLCRLDVAGMRRPNRKVYHFLLAHLLGTSAIPYSLRDARAASASASSESSELDAFMPGGGGAGEAGHGAPTVSREYTAARVAFVRGLSLLDDFCAPLAQLQSLDGAKQRPGKRVEVTPLVPRGPATKAQGQPQGQQEQGRPREREREATSLYSASPNETSMKVILSSLLKRMEELMSLRESLRRAIDSSGAPATGAHAEVTQDVLITRRVIEEVMERCKLVSRQRERREELSGREEERERERGILAQRGVYAPLDDEERGKGSLTAMMTRAATISRNLKV